MPGATSPLQNGQPLKPEPAGPQPSPESDTRTIPPITISRKVRSSVASASCRYRGDGAVIASRTG